MEKHKIITLNKSCRILLRPFCLKKISVASLFVYLLLIFHAAGAQDIPLITSPEKDYHNNIRIYLQEKAQEISKFAVANINSLDDWNNEKGSRYDELVQSLGLNYMPLNKERPDLNVTYTGKIQMDGYRIEKLYFESLPSLYVPANLYVPDNITSPRPAILYLCGHSSGQKVAYQEYAQKFAQLGFVCLIVETTHQGEVSGEHHGCYVKGWFHWYSRGYTPAGVEVWNAIRALDFLSSREEVDAANFGVTGRSGGGAQTWFVAAVDNRVKAACPGVGATTLNEQILTRTVDWHCDCMMPINTFKRDFQDIGALIAPRELLIDQGDRDRLNAIEGVRELFKDIRKIYSFYGVRDNVDFIETPGGHSSTPAGRVKMYSFFLEKLMNKKLSKEEIGDVELSPEKLLSADELQVYVNGVPNDDRTTVIQDEFIKIPEPPQISSLKALYSHRDSVIRYLNNKTFGAFPAEKSSLNPHMIFRSMDKDKFGSSIYSFVPEEGWRLRVDIRWKLNPEENKPLLIVLGNTGDAFSEDEYFTANPGGNWNIAYFNPRGADNAGWESGLQWHVRRASAWTGRTIASMQVYDLLRCIDFCRSLPGVNGDKISIAARDGMGAVALYTALLDTNIESLILDNPPETQNEGSSPNGKGEAIEMLNCLRITDVWQMPALIPKTEITFFNDFPESYKWSEKVRLETGSTPFQYITSN
jgi:cephalosporin-C deacetylase-like acetyl esterase